MADQAFAHALSVTAKKPVAVNERLAGSGPAAVALDDFSGDETGVFARKKRYDSCLLLDRALAPQGAECRIARFPDQGFRAGRRIGFPSGLQDKTRCNPVGYRSDTGRNRVDADPVAAIFSRQRFRQGIDAALARRIGRAVQGPSRASHGTDVDDSARLLGDQIGQDGPAAPQRGVQRACQFQFYLLLVVLVVGLPSNRAAYVVHQHIDATECSHRFFHQLLGSGQRADVDGRGDRLDTVPRQLLHRGNSRIPRSIRNHDATTLRSQAPGGSAAYALASAGDDTRLTLEPLRASVQVIEHVGHWIDSWEVRSHRGVRHTKLRPGRNFYSFAGLRQRRSGRQEHRG